MKEHSDYGPAPRALRLSNPKALLGGAAVGAVALIAPDLVVMLAVGAGQAPPFEALKEGAPLPFPVLAIALVMRQLLLLAGSLLVAFAVSGSAAPRSMGFVSPDPKVLFVGSLGILGLGPLADAMVRALRALAPDIEVGVLEQIDALTAGRSLFVLLPMLALLPGLAEEVYFRGLLQRMFGRGIVAIAASGIVFAAFHLDPMQAAGVLPIGLYLAWLYDRTGSLWVPVAAHALNNGIAVLAIRVAAPADAAGTGDPVPPLVIALGLAWTAACALGVRAMSRETSD